jgi:hypothetical protein
MKAFMLSVIVLMLLPVSGHAGAGNVPADPSFPPDVLLEQLGITRKEIIFSRGKFSNDPTHIEWINHVRSTVSAIDRDRETAVVNIHLTLLVIKQTMDQAFFSGVLDKQEFTVRLAALMQWFQEANRSVLNKKEYGLVFGESDESEADAAGDGSDKKIGFPIANPEISEKMIQEQFDGRILADLNRFYHKQSQEFRDIRNIYETRDWGDASQWQVLQDMLRIEKELDAAFKSYCREKLTDEQFQLLFGHPE